MLFASVLLRLCAAMAKKARLVADPAIGVSDLMSCMEEFLNKAQTQKKLCLFTYVTPPNGCTWRSSPNIQFIIRLAPLIMSYLPVVKNGVIPRQRHKSALTRLDDKKSINMVKGKAQDDWVDYVDDNLRMCLAHLRGLKTSDVSRQRIFKKTDSNQQMQIEEMLSMLHLPPDAGEVVEEKLMNQGEPDEPAVLALAAPELPKASEASDLVVLQDPSDDPFAIFDTVLNKKDDFAGPSLSSSPKSMAATRAAQMSSSPPAKSFLSNLGLGLASDSQFSEEELQQPSSLDREKPHTEKPKPKPKKKAKAKAKATLKSLKTPKPHGTPLRQDSTKSLKTPKPDGTPQRQDSTKSLNSPKPDGTPQRQDSAKSLSGSQGGNLCRLKSSANLGDMADEKDAKANLSQSAKKKLKNTKQVLLAAERTDFLFT